MSTVNPAHMESGIAWHLATFFILNAVREGVPFILASIGAMFRMRAESGEVRGKAIATQAARLARRPETVRKTAPKRPDTSDPIRIPILT
ncbi:hypothetical protein AGR6A_pa20065 [Agrobacterium sp. NCPPB 925]|nr:hypothetical protein AGR6A_pa20065 [Agrobacterium sp. NCPPB 925]